MAQEFCMHIFDSTTNRDLYMQVENFEWLSIEPVCKLEDLPKYAAIETALEALPSDWQERTRLWMHESFPEYQAMNYSVADCLAMEICHFDHCQAKCPSRRTKFPKTRAV